MNFKIVKIFMATSFVIVALGIFADFANAQERPDITLPPIFESGTHLMTVVVPTGEASDIDVFQACCDRIDVDPIIELGCDARVDGEMKISFEVAVVKTPGDDGEVRCYTVNTEEKSDYTSNAYILPFPLKPNQPHLE